MKQSPSQLISKTQAFKEGRHIIDVIEKIKPEGPITKIWMFQCNDLCYDLAGFRGGIFVKNPASHSIEFQQFNFKITAKEPIILPAYKGSTLRGGFGYAFRRAVCAASSLPSNQFNKPGIQI